MPRYHPTMPDDARWSDPILPLRYPLVVVFAIDTVVAIVLTLVNASDHNGFWMNFVYSQLIGLSSISLYLLARKGLAGHVVLKGWQDAALIGLTTLIGFVIGSEVAAWLFSRPSLVRDAFRGDRWTNVVLAATAAAAASCALILLIRSRVVDLQLAAARERERAEAEQARAEAALRLATEARLNLMRTQLEPHMLFNTLANLRALISLDPPRALQMVDRLIPWLRATLGASRRDRVPLRDEFTMLEDYLTLVGIRMGRRLQFSLDLPAELADIEILPLLLQPLVENAVRHGLEPAVAGGRIDVSARSLPSADGPRLQLVVADTGQGFQPGPPSPGGGFGLEQLKARLAASYGSAAGTTIAPAAEGSGTRITIDLPLAAPTLQWASQ